ncbi:GDSL-type esterase/lipase family protein [Salirhabdus salicampi]|uniref:GDSL-type esterase/lipase family protein n=1 Tax=Salirhabdus salicampi TaxID=476102 RepID=UPI0020C308CA|nr:GDSL-type esterase/lipase family protein [Salirhabdus salicampi]MCP8615857.1 GDSL-type esterase/lipase family protein [Salirhabdus salicampi]
MFKRKVWALLLVFLVILPAQVFALPVGDGGPTIGKKERITLVALGDSIAYGTGADDNYGYVDRYADYLRERGNQVNLQNYAIPGLTTEELQSLVEYSPILKVAIKKADIVTISIGGNDLLECINLETGDVDEDCSSATTVLNSFHEVIKTIKSYNNDVDIKTLNIYNPILDVQSENYKKAEKILHFVNTSFRSSHSQIMDVYSAFQHNLSKYTHILEGDIHPNDDGHEVIAKLHYED